MKKSKSPEAPTDTATMEIPSRPPIDLRVVPIGQVDPNDWNPRTHVDPVAREELRASVRAKGIQQPLLLRPTGNRFEVVAGMQRFDAARSEGLEEIPASIQTLTDEEAFEAAMVENIQRRDMHPMDEARAFARWQKFDRAYTDEAIAERLGMPVAYVKRRKRLLSLPATIQDAFLADAITDAHAAIIAKAPDALKLDAFHECFIALEGLTALETRLKAKNWIELREMTAAPASVQEFVDRHVKYDVEELQERLPDLVSTQTAAVAAGGTLVELSASYILSPADKKKFPTLLASQDFDEIGSNKYGEFKKLCAMQERGVITHAGRPRLVTFCRHGNGCPVHHPPPRAAEREPSRSSSGRAKPVADKWQLAERKRQAQQQAYAKLKGAAMRAMAPALLSASLTPALVTAIVKSHELRDIRTKFGLTPNAKNGLAILLAAEGLQKAWNRPEFVKFAKLVGFDFAKFEREQQKRKKAAPATGAAAKAKSVKKSKKAAA